MIKSKFLFVSILLLLIFVSMKVVPSLKDKVLRFSNNIKAAYLSNKDEVSDNYDRYINQAKKIKKLQKEIKELKPQAMLAKSLDLKLKKLLKETNLNYHHPSLYLVRTLSFEKLGNYTRLWLDFKNFDKNKTYGLIYKGYVAGIVKQKDNNPLALLELDPDVALSVFIGAYKAQGVIFGNNTNLKIKFIEKNSIVNEGDEVTTSGKDGIFLEGVKIGRVTKVTEKELYKEAIVEPYIVPTKATYFYAVDPDIKTSIK